MARAHRAGRRKQRHRATPLGLGKRARRQSHQYQNWRHAGLAETGRRLEAAGACVLEAAAAGIAPCLLAPASAARCNRPAGWGPVPGGYRKALIERISEPSASLLTSAISSVTIAAGTFAGNAGRIHVSYALLGTHEPPGDIISEISGLSQH